MEKSRALQEFEKAMGPVDRVLHRFISPTAPFIVEFAGTFFLVLVITMTGALNLNATSVLLAPLAIGFTLMVAIFTGGHVSGGHYNPAVTMSVLLSGRSKITPKIAVGYIIMQLLASVIGALFGWLITQKTAAPAIGFGYNVGEAFVAETLWTFFLCSTVLINLAISYLNFLYHLK